MAVNVKAKAGAKDNKKAAVGVKAAAAKAPAMAGGVVAKALRFDNVEDKDFAPIPGDEYALTVEKVTTRVSKQKKTPSISLMLSVEDGEYKGRKVFDDLWWTEKTRFQYVRFMKSAGLELPEGEVSIEDCAAAIPAGTRVRAVITVDEEYDSNKVKKYKPAD